MLASEQAGGLGREGEHPQVQETVVDCPRCGNPFSLDVDTAAEEQSHFVNCPECQTPLEVFVRCGGGEVLSVSASVD